ncbi:MAG: hypothetical protein IJ125_05030 [Atopobiaceae bacterium]|nr:hypothetical protein [Atopobiaceae bacterium]
MSLESYATIQQYRISSGDESSSDERVEAMLESQSAKLRAAVGIGRNYKLNDDQLLLARELVVDSCRKALVPPVIDGLGAVTGATQASFTANGFSGSYSVQNPSGSAYFDRSTLSAFKRSLGRSQRIGTISPAIGGV